MRKGVTAGALVLASALAVGTGKGARAQGSPGESNHPPRASAGRHPHEQGGHAMHIRREHLDADPLAEAARALVRSGDCARALDAFDVALRSSEDPTLRRDRGLCQERLGHPYPAIDDLRAYLTAAPDASDADDMRGHLAKLEQDTLGYSSASNDVPGDIERGASAEAPPKRVKGHSTVRSDVAMDETEPDEDPMASPLRAGTGWSLAPFFTLRKWGVSPSNIGLATGSTTPSITARTTWAEALGLGVRYSTGSSGALLLELGYEHFNSTSEDLAVVSGLTSQLAFEWRFRLDPEEQNEFVFAPGLGFEHLIVQPSSPLLAAATLGGFAPRIRLGWRHMLASSAALEVSFDVGAVNLFAYSHFPFDSNAPTSFFADLGVTALWGL